MALSSPAARAAGALGALGLGAAASLLAALVLPRN